MYYLYKIDSYYSDHYYIGMTNCFVKRQNAHASHICSLAKYFVSARDKSFKGTQPKCCNPIYEVIAKQIAKRAGKGIPTLQSVKSFCRIFIVHQSESLDIIKRMEDAFVLIEDPAMYNQLKKSAYSGKYTRK